jgi:hypothetical protein
MRASQLGWVVFFTIASSRALAGERWYTLDGNNSSDVCVISYLDLGIQEGMHEQFGLVGIGYDSYGNHKRFFIALKFDNSRMPIAERATLWLASPSLPSYVSGGMNLWRVSTSWNINTDWSTSILQGKKLVSLAPPSPNSWKGIDITNIYNQWRNGTTTNQGLALATRTTTTNVNIFYLSTAQDSVRPRLQVQYDSVSHFRFPLDGGWQKSSHGSYVFGTYWQPATECCYDGTLFKHTGIDWHASSKRGPIGQRGAKDCFHLSCDHLYAPSALPGKKRGIRR